MKTITKKIQDSITPKDAYKLLADGNSRFVNNLQVGRDLQGQVSETSKGQFPFAVVLSCIDSRVPAEIVFDQGIGDIFSVRVAGNVINEDVLGSMEYACKVAGSKILVVMGHTKCGAVNAACNNVELGNITSLLSKIMPAVDMVKKSASEMSEKVIEEVGIQNVRLSIARIRTESPVLAKMEDNQEIDIVGAVYDVVKGAVEFLD